MSLTTLASQQTAQLLRRRAVEQAMRDGIDDEKRERAASPARPPAGDDRFDLLTKYIPVETITIFTAAMSTYAALHETDNKFPWPAVIYGCCAVLTPIVYLLVLYGKQRTAGLAATPFRPALFSPIATTIAFLAWAWSVPGMEIDGVLEGSSARVIGAFAALLVSTLLSLLEPAFGSQPAQTQPPQ